MSEEVAKTNIQRAGELFVHSIWLQSQMCDLIILSRHPDIIPQFIKNPSRIPEFMATERTNHWQKSFRSIKQEFTKEFVISDQHKNDLDAIYVMRNAIAHSHVSIARSYFLYRPTGGKRKEDDIIATLNISPVEDQSDPLTMKLRFDDNDGYMYNFNRIKRLDEECFKSIADSIGIPQSRIR